MGRVKATQKYRKAMVKMIKPTDNRVSKDKREIREKKVDEQALKITEAPQMSSAMFLKYNDQLGPPFHVLIDTNFINFTIKNRIDLFTGFMDCLYAKTTPYVTDCVIGELEKMGQRFRLALKILRDPRVQRLSCSHKGIYADDCLVQRITQHKCYIVATCDRDLRNRIRKVPGVPIMYIREHRFTIERMPDAFGAPKF
jgi:U3 small nucleolar RNA-associated protein 24